MRIHVEKNPEKMSEEQFLREAIKELQEKLKAKGERFTFDIGERIAQKRKNPSGKAHKAT